MSASALREKTARLEKHALNQGIAAQILATEGSYVFAGRKNVLDQFLASRELLTATDRIPQTSATTLPSASIWVEPNKRCASHAK